LPRRRNAARRSPADQLTLVIARCSVDYTGRLSSHLPMATRLIVMKADGSFLIHADSGTKALNWMPPGSRVVSDEVDQSGSYDGPFKLSND
jgi:endonuclease